MISPRCTRKTVVSRSSLWFNGAAQEHLSVRWRVGSVLLGPALVISISDPKVLSFALGSGFNSKEHSR